MIHVIATVHVHPGRRAEFLSAFHTLMPQVHAEVGCIEYGPAVDLATPVAGQILEGDDVVTIIEQWDSVESLHAHLAAPHMNAYRAEVKELVTGVEIRVLQPA